MGESWILPLDAGEATLATSGGKGANLARLARAGFPVSGGFLVTTAAYSAFVAANNLEAAIREILSGVHAEEPQSLEAASAAIRACFAAGAVPAALADALRAAYAAMGRPPVAVRSSATAEDLPEMSFAGQQDTYLNVVGEEALLQAVVNCWSSLWTARAIGYRARNDIPQQDIALAVVVQAMVPSEASGVLFTANPLNGKRTEIVIDATLGLGEALVSGQVEPDHYLVAAAGGRILSKTLGAKALAIRGRSGGGTVTVAEDAAGRQALPDAAIVELARLGRRVADLFGAPQDIEWAWSAGQLFLLQSRPITSLFPLPEGMAPEPLQVLISFGAVQGMLDPMTALGRDFFGAFFAAAGALFGRRQTLESQRVLVVAAERLFINVTTVVRNPVGRGLLRRALTLIEPGTGQAMETLWDDPRLAPQDRRIRLATLVRIVRALGPLAGRLLVNLLRPDVGRAEFQRRAEGAVTALYHREMAATSLAERVALLEQLVDELAGDLLPYLLPGVASGQVALQLLNRLAGGLPGATQEVLEVTRGLPHNVTTEMDLALWATARAIKADPASTARFAQADAPALAADFLAGRLPGQAQTAIAEFLQDYGMRGIAEIDIGRPRWCDDPTPIMQVLGSYLRIEDASQAPDVVFARGAASAETAIGRLVRAVRPTRGGRLKARLVRWMARRVRELAGLRESPKFTVIRILGIVRAGLLESSQALVAAGVLERADDLFFLHLAELRALAAGETGDWRALIAGRRATFARERRRRQVPRVLLSDGQALFGGSGAPADTGDGVIVGSPVSPGEVEGVVHVVFDPHGAQLAPGEILVCPGTDPAWTPLFLAAGGLVMEVGGLMTHGSVVAREYGIPAVVGVHHATTRLVTGQRVRVDGTSGRIVLLDGPAR
ncbi:MAG: PEP-utilizing enzyme [Ardenticatenaceae bacterium]|nr:PEP-utilizing enzyme [Ardenticatenaceae bacterium]